MTKLKVCRICKLVKEEENDFYHVKRTTGIFYRSECKDCKKEYSKNTIKKVKIKKDEQEKEIILTF